MCSAILVATSSGLKSEISNSNNSGHGNFKISPLELLQQRGVKEHAFPSRDQGMSLLGSHSLSIDISGTHQNYEDESASPIFSCFGVMVCDSASDLVAWLRIGEDVPEFCQSKCQR
jgi:hypothetical protein